MKLRKYLAMVPLGVVASIAYAQTMNCTTQIVPCSGPEVLTGWGCSSGCPPSSQGCCAYSLYRVNCDEGPDQWYEVRNCFEVRHCAVIVIPKQYECTVL
jgi:hypothetical protein